MTRSSLSVSSKLEHTARAHWAAEAAMEQAFFEATKHERGFANTEPAPSQLFTSDEDEKSSWGINSRESLFPPPGEGNSPLNADWNRVRFGDKVVINLYKDTSSVGDDATTSTISPINVSASFTVTFRIPPTDMNNANFPMLDVSLDTKPVIQWTLTDGTSQLRGNVQDCTSIICGTDINSGNAVFSESMFGAIGDINLSGFSPTPVNQFISDASSTNKKLKFSFSIIEKLQTSTLASIPEIPFLEYKIETNTPITQDFFTITTTGTYRGLEQILTKKIAYPETLSLFDFTILQ